MSAAESISINSPRIEVAPPTALVDEVVSLRVVGLRPSETVTLRARMQDDLQRWWASAATFRADADGVVALATQAPVSGSYMTIDPMGFIWSMILEDDAQDVSPWAKTTVAPTRVELLAEANGVAVATTDLTRLSVAPDVARIPVRERGLVGTYFQPSGVGRRPAIIVVGGSGGGLSEPSAALFASHGYAALALAYFHFENLPADLVRIPLEYFETAIGWLQSQPGVDSERLAMSGTSRGGELVLLLGARFPAIKAVIGNVPSSVVYGGLASTPDEDDPEPPAWTYRGEGLPFLRSHRNRRNDFSPLPGVPFELTPGFLRTLEDAEQVRAASIPVENIAGPVLLVSGREDAMWPSSVYSERVMQRLAEHRHPYPDQHLSYAGAGHMIGFPYVPSTIHSSLHALTGHLFAFGGNPAATAHAKADSWPRVLAFLEEALRAEETS